MAARTLIPSNSSKISLPRQPFALRHLARDTEGYIKIQLRDHGKLRGEDKETLEMAQPLREHQKQREPQSA